MNFEDAIAAFRAGKKVKALTEGWTMQRDKDFFSIHISTDMILSGSFEIVEEPPKSTTPAAIVTGASFSMAMDFVKEGYGVRRTNHTYPMRMNKARQLIYTDPHIGDCLYTLSTDDGTHDWIIYAKEQTFSKFLSETDHEIKELRERLVSGLSSFSYALARAKEGAKIKRKNVHIPWAKYNDGKLWSNSQVFRLDPEDIEANDWIIKS